MYQQVWWYLSLVWTAGVLTSLCYHQLRDEDAYLRELNRSARLEEPIHTRLVAQRLERLAVDHPKLLEGLALHYTTRREFADAARVLEKLAVLSPGNPALRIELARALDGAKRPRDALSVYQRAGFSFEGDDETRLHIANLYIQLEQFEEAERLYRALVLRRPQSAAIHTKLAQVLVWQGRWEEALTEIERVIPKAHDPSALLLMKARALVANGRLVEGKTLYENLIAQLDKDTRRPSALSMKTLRSELADVLVQLKQWSEVVPVLRKLMEEEPADDSTRNRLIDVLYWAGGYADAALEIERLPVHLRTPERDKQLAELFTALEQHQKAGEWYARYLNRRPDDDRARAKYADVLTWTKEYDKASQEYQRLLRKNGSDTELRKKYVQALLWAGRTNEAAHEFNKSRRSQ